VEVKSTPDEGSIFRFTLPLAINPSDKDPKG
jgi:hypothetical protein